VRRWKSVLSLLSFIFILTMASNAQVESGAYRCKCSDCKNDSSCGCCPNQVATLSGVLKMQDGKYIFLSDEGKEWKVWNPEAFKAKEGHHVQVTGKINQKTSELRVDSVKMMKETQKEKD
jgi:hypothetical protein